MSIRPLPGQKPKRTRHRVSTAIGAVIESLSENFVFPGAPVSASGEADGASALTGGALRVVLPAGTAAGTSTIAGAAIRWEDVTDVLTGTSDLAGQADCIASATGTLDGAGSLDGAASALIFPGTRLLPGQKPQRTRHRVSIAIGAAIESISEQFVFPKTNAVTALGEADGYSLVTAAAMLLTVATGAMDGASAAEGDGIRVALPTGALAGSSATTGGAIRRAVAAGILAGAGDAAGRGNRIVWTTGTLEGAGSTLVGIPTMRIFAPAWGNSSLTGDARASYLVEALTVSQALVEGLGGYVLVNDAETLAGASATSAIQGANLKTGAAACTAASSLSGDADSLLDCAGEADGACATEADTQVAFVASGGVLAGDGFDPDGNPQPSSTLAVAQATAHVAAGASGWSHLEGSAPTPVPADGTLIGSSTVLFLETVICATEGFQGVSDTEASAELKMTTQALSVNLSYAVATANYGPGKLAGALLGAGAAMGLATVAWNERPPR
jgi:hypothetical protein